VPELHGGLNKHSESSVSTEIHTLALSRILLNVCDAHKVNNCVRVSVLTHMNDTDRLEDYHIP